jgi:hypothetical protein
MLGVCNEMRLMEKLWEAAEATLQLPEPEAKYFFEFKGPMPSGHFDNRRSYHRFYLRDKAIVTRKRSTLGVFTTDISRQGIGFLSPVQMLPKERVQLLLTSGTEYYLLLTRCRRRTDNLFECGGRFVVCPKQNEQTNEETS